MKAFTNTENNFDISVYECGNEQCVKDKAISLTKKSYHLFHYVSSGKGVLILNKKEYHISKGTIFFIPRETDAIYFPDKDNPWFYTWLGFDGSKLDELLARLGIDVNHPLIFDKKNNYKQYFDNVISRFSKSGYIDLHIIGSVYQLISEMQFDKVGKIQVSSIEVTIQLAKKFIDNNYQFDIEVVDIAKNANVSPNYLSAIFKKEEKMSTKSYLTKVRMTKATQFLLTNKFNIKEVAKMVGYANQLHFSNEFKKYYGKSPRNYLKEVMNNED